MYNHFAATVALVGEANIAITWLLRDVWSFEGEGNLARTCDPASQRAADWRKTCYTTANLFYNPTPTCTRARALTPW